MPTVLQVNGYRFFFFSNESDEPVHIHVESAGNYAKFWVEPVALAKSIGYNSKELTKLHKLVEKHKDLFKEKWHEYFNR